PAARGIRRRTRSGDAGLPAPHLAGRERGEDRETAVRGARAQRSARALYRGAADRRDGAQERHAGVVFARGQRGPRLRAQGKPGLLLLRDHPVPAGNAVEALAEGGRLASLVRVATRSGLVLASGGLWTRRTSTAPVAAPSGRSRSSGCSQPKRRSAPRRAACAAAGSRSP